MREIGESVRMREGYPTAVYVTGDVGRYCTTALL